MAKVTAKRSKDIDSTLEWSLRVWRALPEAAEEIEYWTPAERLDFLYEWPLEEQKLAELREYSEKGLMNPLQERRYRTLEEAVAQNRHLIDELQERYNR